VVAFYSAAEQPVHICTWRWRSREKSWKTMEVQTASA